MTALSNKTILLSNVTGLILENVVLILENVLMSHILSSPSEQVVLRAYT